MKKINIFCKTSFIEIMNKYIDVWKISKKLATFKS